jgi:zinc D-Ala-D-Ala dipeptidase
LLVDLFPLVFCLVAQAQPVVFRIEPVRPVAELRVEALVAKPPVEKGDFGRSQLTDVAKLDHRIKLDILA